MTISCGVLLSDKGAKMEVKDEDEWMPTYCASESINEAVIKISQSTREVFLATLILYSICNLNIFSK
ncbi:hypothetical protein LZ32DRAFT_435262 [Colletotrichum eremochloae]|nr:hypothetical protein LZ32DRAFT_435262 [Colletotrichum eremochloae]